jgi:hypothetical protein
MRRRPVPHIAAFYEEVPRPWQPEPLASTYVCDLCGEQCAGLPAGKGLMLWWRGTEWRVDEPPLCEECAVRVTMGAVVKWALEDEDES